MCLCIVKLDAQPQRSCARDCMNDGEIAVVSCNLRNSSEHIYGQNCIENKVFSSLLLLLVDVDWNIGSLPRRPLWRKCVTCEYATTSHRCHRKSEKPFCVFFFIFCLSRGSCDARQALHCTKQNFKIMWCMQNIRIGKRTFGRANSTIYGHVLDVYLRVAREHTSQHTEQQDQHRKKSRENWMRNMLYTWRCWSAAADRFHWHSLAGLDAVYLKE